MTDLSQASHWQICYLWFFWGNSFWKIVNKLSSHTDTWLFLDAQRKLYHFLYTASQKQKTKKDWTSIDKLEDNKSVCKDGYDDGLVHKFRKTLFKLSLIMYFVDSELHLYLKSQNTSKKCAKYFLKVLFPLKDHFNFPEFIVIY